MVAIRYGLVQHVEEVNANDFNTVERLPHIFDEPFGDSSAFPTFRLANLASRTVKVALSGDGGDELFAGYRRYAFHQKEERARNAIPSYMRRALFGSLASIYPQSAGIPRVLRARQTFRELSLDSAEGYFLNVSIADNALRDGLFSEAHKKTSIRLSNSRFDSRSHEECAN